MDGEPDGRRTPIPINVVFTMRLFPPRRVVPVSSGTGAVSMRFVVGLIIALALVGCATITRGTTQVVAIDTPGVPGATCTIQTQSGPQVVTTPGSVTLSKGSASLPVQCTKQCYLLGSSILPSGTEAMAAGNVIFGGVVGLGVDAASGAMNKYPDLFTVAMSPDPACHQAAPPSKRKS